MRQLDYEVKIEKNKIASSLPLVYLAEINLQDDLILRFTSNNENVNFNGKIFYASAMKVGKGSINSEGTMTTLSLDIGNVWSTFGHYIDQLEGGVDKTVTMYVVFKYGTTWISVFSDTYKIIATTVSPQVVHLELAMPNLLMERAQSLTYMAGACNFDYGSVECNVSSETLATYPNCRKTLGDCIDRHRDRITQGLPFGGFPGLFGAYYVVK